MEMSAVEVRAAVLGEDSRLSLRSLALAEPGSGEVLVRVVAAGVCHTDLTCALPNSRVPRPVVLGHEGAGIVETVGPGVDQLRPGDHVVMTFASCGRYRSCLRGEPAYCHQSGPLNFGCACTPLSDAGRPVHGGFFGQSSFATHALANERNCVQVPGDLPLELLAPLGCGVQTGAGAVLHELDVRPGRSLAVFGAGVLGLSAVMAARHAGASRIVAVDRVPARVELALSLGADAALLADGRDLADAVRALVPGGVDAAFDTTGVGAVMRAAFDSLAPRGTCGFVASPREGGDFGVPVRELLHGRSVKGIIEGNSNPHLFIPLLAELYRRGRFPFDRLVRFYDLADIDRAFADMENGVTVKPVLRMP